MNQLSIAIDLFAIVVTIAYILKLLGESQSHGAALLVEKRSLHGQAVRVRG